MSKSNERRVDPKEDQLRRQHSLHPHPERVRDPLFVAGGFFDARDLVQVRYEMVRRVRSEGQSIRKTARVFGVSRPTYYETQERLEKGGPTALLPTKRGPKHGHKLGDDVITALREVQLQSPDSTTADLVQFLQTRFGLKVHRRSIERALARGKKRRSTPSEGLKEGKR